MSRRRENPLDNWVPKTQLGRQVYEGQVSSIYEIFEEGHKIKEVEIVDVLVPDLKDEVININLVQKQTDAGESSRFTALVAVGNENGLIGIGLGKAKRVRNAIEKGIRLAKLNLYPIRMGCGSWECEDCWSKSIGKTTTTNSFAFATFEALKQTMSIMTPRDWA